MATGRGRAVLTVQPTVPGLPWSARQAQMSSTKVLLAFTIRLFVLFKGVTYLCGHGPSRTRQHARDKRFVKTCYKV